MRSAIEELFDAGESAPNAALDFADEGERKGVIALELSHPRYDARTRVLRYRIRRLSSLSNLTHAPLAPERHGRPKTAAGVRVRAMRVAAAG